MVDHIIWHAGVPQGLQRRRPCRIAEPRIHVRKSISCLRRRRVVVPQPRLFARTRLPWFARQPSELFENAGNELLSPRIAPIGRLGEQRKEITRLLSDLRPSRRGHRGKKTLEFFLTLAQRSPIGLELGAVASDLGGLLSHHPAVLVQCDWIVRHANLPSISDRLSSTPMNTRQPRPRTVHTNSLVLRMIQRLQSLGVIGMSPSMPCCMTGLVMPHTVRVL